MPDWPSAEADVADFLAPAGRQYFVSIYIESQPHAMRGVLLHDSADEDLQKMSRITYVFTVCQLLCIGSMDSSTLYHTRAHSDA